MKAISFIIAAIVLLSIGLGLAASAARTIDTANSVRDAVLVEALR